MRWWTGWRGASRRVPRQRRVQPPAAPLDLDLARLVQSLGRAHPASRSGGKPAACRPAREKGGSPGGASASPLPQTVAVGVAARALLLLAPRPVAAAAVTAVGVVAHGARTDAATAAVASGAGRTVASRAARVAVAGQVRPTAEVAVAALGGGWTSVCHRRLSRGNRSRRHEVRLLAPMRLMDCAATRHALAEQRQAVPDAEASDHAMTEGRAARAARVQAIRALETLVRRNPALVAVDAGEREPAQEHRSGAFRAPPATATAACRRARPSRRAGPPAR